MTSQRAVVVFADGNDRHVIESLRRRFDPLANVIAAHVTLVFPFASDLGELELQSHITRAVEGLLPFRARFEGVAEADEYLFLDATVGRDVFIELHDRLYRGVLGEHLSPTHVYRPHITIGRIRDHVERERALGEAHRERPSVEWGVSDVNVFRLP